MAETKVASSATPAPKPAAVFALSDSSDSDSDDFSFVMPKPNPPRIVYERQAAVPTFDAFSDESESSEEETSPSTPKGLGWIVSSVPADGYDSPKSSRSHPEPDLHKLPTGTAKLPKTKDDTDATVAQWKQQLEEMDTEFTIAKIEKEIKAVDKERAEARALIREQAAAVKAQLQAGKIKDDEGLAISEKLVQTQKDTDKQLTAKRSALEKQLALAKTPKAASRNLMQELEHADDEEDKQSEVDDEEQDDAPGVSIFDESKLAKNPDFEEARLNIIGQTTDILKQVRDLNAEGIHIDTQQDDIVALFKSAAHNAVKKLQKLKHPSKSKTYLGEISMWLETMETIKTMISVLKK